MRVVSAQLPPGSRTPTKLLSCEPFCVHTLVSPVPVLVAAHRQHDRRRHCPRSSRQVALAPGPRTARWLRSRLRFRWSAPSPSVASPAGGTGSSPAGAPASNRRTSDSRSRTAATVAIRHHPDARTRVQQRPEHPTAANDADDGPVQVRGPPGAAERAPKPRARPRHQHRTARQTGRSTAGQQRRPTPSDSVYTPTSRTRTVPRLHRVELMGFEPLPLDSRAGPSLSRIRPAAPGSFVTSVTRDPIWRDSDKEIDPIWRVQSKPGAHRSRFAPVCRSTTTVDSRTRSTNDQLKIVRSERLRW
jgi:hypothetical protein